MSDPNDDTFAVSGNVVVEVHRLAGADQTQRQWADEARQAKEASAAAGDSFAYWLKYLCRRKFIGPQDSPFRSQLCDDEITVIRGMAEERFASVDILVRTIVPRLMASEPTDGGESQEWEIRIEMV